MVEVLGFEGSGCGSAGWIEEGAISEEEEVNSWKRREEDSR
jgi:hypothetical protein